MASKPETTEVIKPTLQYCELKRIVAWRNQSGTITVWNERGKPRQIRMSRPGVSDIIGVMPDGTGRIFVAEAKYGKNRPTREQDAFMGSVREAGGVAFSFWSLDEFIERIEKATSTASG